MIGDPTCPICHGEKVVHYDLTGCRIPIPIRCDCCKGTGKRLWLEPECAAAQQRRLNAVEYGRRGGGRQSRRRGPTPKTRIALSCSQYGVYVVACHDAGYEPVSIGAWYRVRWEYRDRVEGRAEE